MIDDWKAALHDVVSYMLLQLGYVENRVDHGRGRQTELVGDRPYFGDHLVRSIKFCS